MRMMGFKKLKHGVSCDVLETVCSTVSYGAGQVKAEFSRAVKN